MTKVKYTTAASIAHIEKDLRKLSENQNGRVKLKFLEEDRTIARYEVLGVEIKIPTILRRQEPPWIIEIDAESDVEEVREYLQSHVPSLQGFSLRKVS